MQVGMAIRRSLATFGLLLILRRSGVSLHIPLQLPPGPPSDDATWLMQGLRPEPHVHGNHDVNDQFRLLRNPGPPQDFHLTVI